MEKNVESVAERDRVSLVRSRQRVADHGEVFTPAWMVDDMLDRVAAQEEMDVIADLARPLHEANDPSKWRAVSTGKTRSDGSAIVLYYNKATRQSTFDAPMFATWKQLGDPAAGRQKAKMLT